MARASASEALAVKAVLFDLDGTLVDTIPDLHAAVCAMLRDLGQPELSLEVVSHFVGRGVHSLVKRSLARSLDGADDSSPAPAAALERFRHHYCRENGRNATLYPGVIAGLEALKAMRMPMALVTNKPQAFTLPLLELTGLSGYFDVVVGGDVLPKVKPDPMALVWVCGRLGVSPADALFIGDSVNDFLAGRAAGCHVFLLPYGYNEGRDVQELDCDAIVPTIESAVERIRYRTSLP